MTESSSEAAARAVALREQIEGHNRSYYDHDDPTVGDDQYDALLNELRDLEAEYPELVTLDSPTQRVGSRRLERFEPVQHAIPMLSLGNARGGEEFRAWVERMRSHLERESIAIDDFNFVVEPKIDGLAVSLRYEDGVFVTGATRGEIDWVRGVNSSASLRTLLMRGLIEGREDERDKRRIRYSLTTEALAPFTALLQSHNDKGPDKQPIFGINDATITLGDLRKAVAALKKAGVEL